MTASANPDRTFLVFLGLAFLPYGLWCLAAPGFLEQAAGVAATTPTATTEIRAMYGGLQAAFGLLMLAAVRDSRLDVAALACAAFLVPGLALSRLAGLAVDGGLSAYTGAALVFEFGSGALAVVRLRRALPASGAPPLSRA